MLAAGAGEGASFWGTLEYVAPEVVRFGAAAYSPAADWWGLGVLIYELLLGLVPWDGSDPDQIMEQIKAADVVWPPQGMVSQGERHILILHVFPARFLAHVAANLRWCKTSKTHVYISGTIKPS